MADNYLEKKMDDYRCGVSNAPRRSVVSAPRNPQSSLGEPQRVALLIANPSLRDALIATLRQFQHRVAFAATDNREGTRLAQSHGALFIPVTDLTAPAALTFLTTTIHTRWQGLDALITDLPAILPTITQTLPTTRTLLLTNESEAADNSYPLLSSIILPKNYEEIREVNEENRERAEKYNVNLAKAVNMLVSPLSCAISSVTVRESIG
ncbi:MAG: hypothetical protein HDS52_05530 [Barnesiella sp.]|nr:hypothetical protein [Barnesiella sp.]